MKKVIFLTFIITILWSPHARGAAPKAVDLDMARGESAIYILYEDGVIVTAGDAVNYGSTNEIAAADFTLTPSLKGYYVLDAEGRVYSFGDAILFGQPVTGKSSFVDMELAGEGFYFLQSGGIVTTVGQAVFYGEMQKDQAVDLEISQDGGGYYILYEDGTIAFFGSAVNRGFTQAGKMRAVDLEIVNGGYYVLYDNGTVLNFGNAVPMPSTISTDNPVVDIALTTRGYRTLDSTGETKSFLRLDAQGTIGWYAQAKVRQVITQATATPTATPAPNTNYFEFTPSNFNERIIGKLAENISIPAGLTTGQTSLPSGGTFLAVAPEENETARQILYFSNEDLSKSDNPGTVFATLVSQRGHAAIRGISYSSEIGMTVALEDDYGTFLLLIEGDFEPSAISGYSILR